MGVIDNLNTIKTIKEQIKMSISEKGIDMNGVVFNEYPDKIQEIKTGGDGKLIVKDWGVKFQEYPFDELPEWIDFTGTEDYSEMFKKCDYLITATGIDWNSAKKTQQMFAGCRHLNILSLCQMERNEYVLNLPNVNQCYGMFQGISNYESNYKTFNLNIPNAVETSGLFSSFIPSRQYDGLSLSINAPKVKYASNMFNNCMSGNIDVTLGNIENGLNLFYNVMYDYTGEINGGRINLSCNTIINATGILDRTIVEEIYLGGDWSQATIDSTSFNCNCKRFNGLRGFKNGNLNLSNMKDLEYPYALNLINYQLGTPDKPLYIYFNDALSDYFTEEDVELALAKNWIISF